MNCGFIILMKSMKRNKTLKHMILEKIGIDDHVALDAYEYLKINSTLLQFNLAYNEFTNKGFKIIINALDYNQVIDHIGFEGNNIDAGINKIIKSSNSKNSLKKIRPDDLAGKHLFTLTEYF